MNTVYYQQLKNMVAMQFDRDKLKRLQHWLNNKESSYAFGKNEELETVMFPALRYPYYLAKYLHDGPGKSPRSKEDVASLVIKLFDLQVALEDALKAQKVSDIDPDMVNVLANSSRILRTSARFFEHYSEYMKDRDPNISNELHEHSRDINGYARAMEKQLDIPAHREH
jgi:hypothetical protein